MSVPIVVGLGLALGWINLVVAVLATLAVIVDALKDLYQVLSLKPLEIQRKVTESLPVNRWVNVRLKIRNPNSHSVNADVYDHVPTTFKAQTGIRVRLQAYQTLNLDYQTLPQQRGDAEFGHTEYWLQSKNWLRRLYNPQSTVVRIYPDFNAAQKTVLSMVDSKLQATLRKRRRGDGTDFLQLREYRVGDAMKNIAWKTSARHQKLITKEYQDSRDQQFILMVDCGRYMRHADSDNEPDRTVTPLTHLDHSLNACIVLSQIALQQGDAVGCYTFGGTERWVPPKKGHGQIHALLRNLYDIQSRLTASDYIVTAEALLKRQRKRSVVIIITNTRDEQVELQHAVALLRRKHLVVIANLREAFVDTILQTPVVTLEDAQLFNAMVQYQQHRQSLQQSLKRYTPYVSDVIAQHLPATLATQYFKVKAES